MGSDETTPGELVPITLSPEEIAAQTSTETPTAPTTVDPATVPNESSAATTSSETVGVVSDSEAGVSEIETSPPIAESTDPIYAAIAHIRNGLKAVSDLIVHGPSLIHYSAVQNVLDDSIAGVEDILDYVKKVA